MYTPSDSLLGPIIHAVAELIRNNIAGVSVVYEQPPDGPPEDGSVVLPLASYKIVDDTNGRLTIDFVIAVKHFVVRGSYPENVMAAYSYMVPYFQVFASWANANLGGLVQDMTPTNGGVTQLVQAGQVFVALLTNVTIRTEFLIPTS